MEFHKAIIFISLVSSSAIAGTIDPEVKPLLDILSRGTKGAEIRQRLGKALTDKNVQIDIRMGDVSRTEFKALRRIQDSKPRNWNISVYISENKNPIDQTLDLAHELTHALSDRLNPYDPELKVESYVAHGIEGEGGEANAILNECIVGRELLGRVNRNDEPYIRKRCTSVWQQTLAATNKRNPASETDLKKDWRKSFYAVGEHFHWVQAVLQNFPVSRNSPQFLSAVAKQPYPLALIEEFTSLNKDLCSRTRNRLMKNTGTVLDRVFLKKRCFGY